MNMLHSLLPYIGQALILAVLITLLAGRWVEDLYKRRIVVVVLLVAGLFVPVFGLTAAQWLRSVVGDLSVLTLVILTNILAQRLFNFNLLNPASRTILLLGVVLLGVVFYPLALGLSLLDPYHFGYTPSDMTVLLVSVSVIAWLRGQRALAVVILLPLLAFDLRLLESANLWDYLLDPILFIYAVIQIVPNARFVKFIKNKGIT